MTSSIALGTASDWIELVVDYVLEKLHVVPEVEPAPAQKVELDDTDSGDNSSDSSDLNLEMLYQLFQCCIRRFSPKKSDKKSNCQNLC